MESNFNESETKNTNLETTNEISPNKPQENSEEEQFHDSYPKIIKVFLLKINK